MIARKMLLALAALVLVATVAEARPRPGGQIGGRSFEANKTFGLGLELGAPTGITAKYFLSSDHALDFGLGFSYSYGSRDGIHVYADYLFHPVSLISDAAFELPFYVGIGARFWSFDYNNNGIDDDASAIGVRVPVGLAFDFNTVPLDAFFQIVPALDFYSGYADHDIYLNIDASIGVRYWFN